MNLFLLEQFEHLPLDTPLRIYERGLTVPPPAHCGFFAAHTSSHLVLKNIPSTIPSPYCLALHVIPYRDISRVETIENPSRAVS